MNFFLLSAISIFAIMFLLFLGFRSARALIFHYRNKSLLKMIIKLSYDAESLVKKKNDIIYLFNKPKYFFETRGYNHFCKYKRNGIGDAGDRVEGVQFKLLYKKIKNIYIAYCQNDMDTLKQIKMIDSCLKLVI